MKIGKLSKIHIFDKIYVKIRNVLHIWYLTADIWKIRILANSVKIFWVYKPPLVILILPKISPRFPSTLHVLIHNFSIFISFCLYSCLFLFFFFHFLLHVFLRVWLRVRHLCESLPYSPYLDLGMLYSTHYFCNYLVVLFGLLELPTVWLFFFFPFFHFICKLVLSVWY